MIPMKTPLSRAIAIALFISAGALAIFLAVGNDINQTKNRTSGEALVGGAFELTDHTGRRVTDQDFRNQYLLVFFGFTNCPDVCPTSLQAMTETMELLGEKATKVRPLFITVDPERDTAALLASYVANFHERLVGLTGSPDDVKAAASAYRIYYAKSEGGELNGEYTMDHSSIIYFMGPDGKFLTHFTHGTSAEKMREEMSKFL